MRQLADRSFPHKAFVDGLAEHSADRPIVAAAIGLAGALGATSIAEGVETLHQVASLCDLGCDLAQGYHFSRPKPPGDFEEMMKTEGCFGEGRDANRTRRAVAPDLMAHAPADPLT